MRQTIMNLSKVNVLFTVSLLMLSSFQNVFATEAEATINSPPQAKPVDVTIISEQSIRLWKEFSGRLSAVDYVEVRPQASGLITEIKFEDGQFVSKGDVLYIIDPRPLKAIVDQKKAELISAQNSYAFAEKEHKRAIDLINKKMVAEQILDDRFNTKLIARSEVNRAKAELAAAEINLSYTTIKAPISGRVSRTELTQGNLVSAGTQAPLLTTIVSNKSIYADFEVDEHTYLRYMNGVSSDARDKLENPVELRLQSGENFYKGKIYAFDNKIDPASGTIRARAVFDNPQGKLLSGMYARLKLGSIAEEKTILISERAIGTDQNRKFVYIVNADNKIAYQQVELGDSINGFRIVHSGLAIGDMVIVRGLMRIQPGMLVEPQVTTDLGNL